MRNYHINSAPLRRLFDVICPFFQAFCALPYTVAPISKHCMASRSASSAAGGVRRTLNSAQAIEAAV
jgi:hypothetical protein